MNLAITSVPKKINDLPPDDITLHFQAMRGTHDLKIWALAEENPYLVVPFAMDK